MNSRGKAIRSRRRYSFLCWIVSGTLLVSVSASAEPGISSRDQLGILISHLRGTVPCDAESTPNSLVDSEFHGLGKLSDHPSSLLEFLAAEKCLKQQANETARAHLQRAISLYEKDLRVDHATLAEFVSSTPVKTNELIKADPELLQCPLALTRSVGASEHVYVGVMFNDLGVLTRKAGDRNLALLLYVCAAAVYEKFLPAHDIRLAHLANNIAEVYRYQYRYVRAAAFHKKAVEIKRGYICSREDCRNARFDYAISLKNLGICYLAAGNLNDAVPTLQAAIHEFGLADEKNNAFLTHAKLELFNAFHLRGQHEAAAEVEGNLSKQLDSLPEDARELEAMDGATILEAAVRYFKTRQDAHSAVRFQSLAVSTAERAYGNNEEVARLESDLAWLEFDADEPESARKHLNEANTEQGSQFANPTIHTGLALAAWMGREKPRLSEHISAANRAYADYLEGALLTGAEWIRQKRFQDAKVHLDVIASVTFEERDASPAHSVLLIEALIQLKGRVTDAIGATLKAAKNSSRSKTQRTLNELRIVRRQQAKSAFQLARGTNLEPVAATAGRLQILEGQARQLEIELGESFDQLDFPANVFRFVTREEIETRTPFGTAVVEYLEYSRVLKGGKRSVDRNVSRRYGGCVYGPGTKAYCRDLGEAEEIDRAIKAWRKKVAVGVQSEFERLELKSKGRQLYRTLLEPFATRFAGARSLVIVPDGAIDLVPFAALADDAYQYLIHKPYDISYALSSREVSGIEERGHFSKEGMVVFANPDFGEIPDEAADNVSQRIKKEYWFKPLPHTAEEAKGINRLFSRAIIKSNGDVNENELQKLGSATTVHLATHGFFVRDSDFKSSAPSSAIRESFGLMLPSAPVNPMWRAGLALAWANETELSTRFGVVTAADIALLDLSHTRLVVLSACESGVSGRDEDDLLYGMRRALIMAGSQAQVTSLWLVSSPHTAALMTRFYEYLLADKPPSAALALAQRQLIREDGGDLDAFFWAAFVMTGH